MSPDEDLMRCLDEQFARVHAKLDRILSEMLDHEYEALPSGGHAARGQRWRVIEAILERLLEVLHQDREENSDG
jgi:hypothetical protein